VVDESHPRPQQGWFNITALIAAVLSVTLLPAHD